MELMPRPAGRAIYRTSGAGLGLALGYGALHLAARRVGLDGLWPSSLAHDLAYATLWGANIVVVELLCGYVGSALGDGVYLSRRLARSIDSARLDDNEGVR